MNHFHLIPPRCCALLAFSAIVPIVALSMNGAEIGASSPPKPAKPSPLSGKEERATFSLPPGFEIELVAEESAGVGKFVPLAFDQKGRLWTTTAFEYPVDANENAAQASALYENPGKDKVLVFDTPFAPGPRKPRVFADGLAIPLGVLPYKDGCYVQHGPDIVILRDTDSDGRADQREVILTGFGVQDSHLFPHQFMRAPGGWIWIAQGAFNYGKVRRPGDPAENAVQFDQTRMAKFRPDGSQFTITSNGPCNIWGLVMNGEGEAFIQEANDFGYPVMPFHEYANYPGCSDRQWKSYAPEFPGTAPDFRMGGTGLSGLALTDKAGPFPEPWRDVMLVANPITNRIQAIRMHRDGPRWRLEKLPDFVISSDEWFRPVAITVGPDGCLYIVDWYNKIISHNEVPRTHPDRDKTRGRIWRVKATGAKPFEVPDFTKLSGEELIARLGGASLAQSHLAWQAIIDRNLGDELHDRLSVVAADARMPATRRIGALWSIKGELTEKLRRTLASDFNPQIRREVVQMIANSMQPSPEQLCDWFGPFVNDSDPEVRAAFIRSLGERMSSDDSSHRPIMTLLRVARAPMAEPVSPSTRDGKPIKVGKAYDREFERYLVRIFLERQPEVVSKFLDSGIARDVPSEAALLAALALEPKASASRVAKIIPALQREPGKEEVLRLAQFPEEPGVADALRAALNNPTTRTGVAEALLAMRTRLDPAKLAPLLADAAKQLLTSADESSARLGIQLAGAFELSEVEPQLVELASSTTGKGDRGLLAVRALAQLNSSQTELFSRLAMDSADPQLRDAALVALASSKSADAGERVFKLWPNLPAPSRRTALDKLSATKSGAGSIVAAASAGTLPQTALDAALLDRLLAVLGDKDPGLNALVSNLGTLFRPVLTLDGNEEAWAESGVSLDGALTVETWVRLADGITNADGILGVPGQVDINFHNARFRVWAGPAVNDVAVAKKKITPGMWTHVAATRNADGEWKLYIDGELDGNGTQRAAHRIENVRIAWTAAPGGTKGALAGFRIWNRERTPVEIRANFDREFARGGNPSLVFVSSENDWGKLHSGAKIVVTSDLPPMLAAGQAAQLEEKFARYSTLAAKYGEVERGKTAATVCRACHLMGTEGLQIGPNLSGVGAMGTEAILRNILTPNAAMESAYRIYRVEKRDGSVLDAFFVSEDKEAVVIRLPGSLDQRIPKREIARTEFLRRSLMPEGLLDAFSPEQVSDLFAYLRTLK